MRVCPTCPSWALLTKGFESEILNWFGIVGGALTLFGMFEGVLKLAPWARLLVQHWKEWTHAFWLWAFGWLGIHLPPQWTPVLSFLLFGSLLTIGQAVQFKRAVKNQLIEDKYQRPFHRTALRVGIYTLISMIVWGPVVVIPVAVYFLISGKDPVLTSGENTLLSVVGVLPLVILIIRFARDRLNAGVTICLMIIFWIIITLQYKSDDYTEAFHANLAAVAMIWVLPLILLSVAPAKAVSRRLIFLAIGLILLIALNELSKLGLHVTAPKPAAALLQHGTLTGDEIGVMIAADA